MLHSGSSASSKSSLSRTSVREFAPELPQSLDVGTQALGADGREAEVGHQGELRTSALQRARAHVLGARIAAAEEILGLLGERAVCVARARVRE